MEKAILKVKSEPSYNNWTMRQAGEVLRQVAELPDREKDQLMTLKAQENSSRDLLLRIIANNCIKVDEKHFGVFHLISRINHSCWPNCVDSKEKEVKEVTALRNIGKGEEITMSYLSCNEGTSTMRSAKHLLISLSPTISIQKLLLSSVHWYP